jgi:hypothetical protein
MRRLTLALTLVAAAAAARPVAQIRLADESDRAAFRAWFVFLADAQFYRPAADVGDCAALVRHAFREALRAHTPEWRRQAALPLTPSFPDVRRRPETGPDRWPLFRISGADPPKLGEFADAHTIVRYNARLVSRDVGAARPGDLLYFHQTQQASPDHLMVVIGPSQFEPDGSDWVVYHTGPIEANHAAAPGDGGAGSAAPGEVRKTRLADLQRHPALRWRPDKSNTAFVGVFRLIIL